MYADWMKKVRLDIEEDNKLPIETHISNLKQYIKDDEIIEKDGSDFANFCKGHIDDIQAVLNELEKKQEEVKLKREAIVEYQEWVIEQDKIINEMAKMINSHDIDENICKNIQCTDGVNRIYKNCKECIKEYFTNKVEKEGK